jgi:hypothetical protein
MNLNKKTAEWQSLFSVAPAELRLIFVVYHAIVYILIKAVIRDKQKQNNKKKKMPPIETFSIMTCIAEKIMKMTIEYLRDRF